LRTAALISTLALVALAVASCGGQSTSSTDRVIGDADAADGQSEAGTFACGDALCAETELCVYPACGCAVIMEPMTDAGSCPDGTAFSDVIESCFVPPKCQPAFCAPPPDPDSGATYYCTGQDGTLSGIISGPLPSGSSHVCHGNCA
jgi:hypothetical protein